MNVVLQQSLLLAKWITQFNPENINSYDLTLPEDLKSFQEFVTQSMDEIAFTNIPSYHNKAALSKKAERMFSLESCRTPAVKRNAKFSAKAKGKILAQFKKKNLPEISWNTFER